jgi:hypothetical protein
MLWTVAEGRCHHQIHSSLRASPVFANHTAITPSDLDLVPPTTTGMEPDADGQTLRRGLFIGAVGVRPRRGSSEHRPSA